RRPGPGRPPRIRARTLASWRERELPGCRSAAPRGTARIGRGRGLDPRRAATRVGDDVAADRPCARRRIGRGPTVTGADRRSARSPPLDRPPDARETLLRDGRDEGAVAGEEGAAREPPGAGRR